MPKQPSRYGQLWTRDELILAFHLYCRIPFQKTKASTPEVQELAGLLQRSPASVARKLGNFGPFDPELRRRSISGLAHGSKLDREVWDEFHRDWSELVLAAHRLRESLSLAATAEEPLPEAPQGPSERRVIATQRIHQSFFRQTVLSSYNLMCCITGLNVQQCLIASHIVPWSADATLRADPTNGLCLSATFDRLFDSGLMAIADDLTVRFSDRILCHGTPAVETLIVRYQGGAIYPPTRFMPSLQCLEWHRKNVFDAHLSRERRKHV